MVTVSWYRYLHIIPSLLRKSSRNSRDRQAYHATLAIFPAGVTIILAFEIEISLDFLLHLKYILRINVLFLSYLSYITQGNKVLTRQVLEYRYKKKSSF